MDEDAIRDGWKTGAYCQIYSNSKKKWFQGEIADIFIDEEGEWLEVQYDKYMSKQVQRYGSHIRPRVLIGVTKTQTNKNTQPDNLKSETASTDQELMCIGETKLEIKRYKFIPEKSKKLVLGFIRNAYKNNNVPNEINVICSLFYFCFVGWDSNSKYKSSELEITGLKGKSSILNSKVTLYQTKDVYHTIFLTPIVGPKGKYEFKFKFTGVLEGTKNELALGIVDTNYSTPLTGSIGIGDCKYSCSYYIASRTTYIYHDGKDLCAPISGGFKKDETFTFVVENKGKQCCIDFYYHEFQNGCKSITAPINCVKVGVSMLVTKLKAVSLELVSYSVK